MANRFDQPMVYQIRVKGHLGCQWSDWFGGLTITPTDDGDTLLTGQVEDQAALHGLLRKVRDLGMALISAVRVDPPWANAIDDKQRIEEGERTMTTNEIHKGVYSMFEVSTFRLYLLRGMYVFMVVGLAIFKLGPAILHPENLSPQDGVIVSVLGAFALLAVLGIRYPLRMLPLLFFEFVWKLIWVLAFGVPLLLSGGLDPNVSFGGTETLTNCLLGVVLVPLVTPWGYVLEHYVKAPGDRWGRQVTVRPLPGDEPKLVP